LDGMTSEVDGMGWDGWHDNALQLVQSSDVWLTLPPVARVPVMWLGVSCGSCISCGGAVYGVLRTALTFRAYLSAKTSRRKSNHLHTPDGS
jgi:hypothetical protein